MSCTVSLAEDLFELARTSVSAKRIFEADRPAPNLFDLPAEPSWRRQRETPQRSDEDAERWDGLS